MKNLIYFFEFLIIIILFTIFRIIGYKAASNLGFFIGKIFGPIFRSKSTIIKNIKNFKSSIDYKEIDEIINNMWGNYGRILAEYPYIPSFRNKKLENFLDIEGIKNLKKIKESKKPCVFISGHFNNFELMAMLIEREGIDLSAVYRPLNNKFLNLLMEYLRKKYICKHQIKKGIKGVREAIEFIKKNYSIALMIDQRVSEGERIDFFNQPALTTTLPAQLAIKFNLSIIPVFIERDKNNFIIKFHDEIRPSDFKNKIDLTKKLNNEIEKMILKNPNEWIWSHNRWK